MRLLQTFLFDGRRMNKERPKPEKIGVVGMSGGGKTTLLHLLQRFIEPPKGTIFIDNQDISDVKEESLHQAIAFIPQDTSLFHRSIGENICSWSANISGMVSKNLCFYFSSSSPIVAEYRSVGMSVRCVQQ